MRRNCSFRLFLVSNLKKTLETKKEETQKNMSDLQNEQTALTASTAAVDLQEEPATEDWPVADDSSKDPFVGRTGN